MSPDSFEEVAVERVAYSAMRTLRRVQERRRERRVPVDANFIILVYDAHNYSDESVYTRVAKSHFEAWRAVARWLGSVKRTEMLMSITFDGSQTYQQARFLADLMRREYVHCLEDLWQRVADLATGSNTGVRLWETFTVACERMSLKAIKTCSYKGAVLHVDEGCPMHWVWYGPGNWCYATMWFLIKRAAWHSRDLHVCVENRAFGAAARIHQSMTKCEERWPRQWPAFYELAGDLFEMLLARGYSDREVEYIIDDFSLITANVIGIYRNMLNNFRLPRAPHIEPYLFADALLLAWDAHRTLEWVPFNRMIRVHAPLGTHRVAWAY